MGRKKVFEAAGFVTKGEAITIIANTLREEQKEARRLKGSQLGDALAAKFGLQKPGDPTVPLAYYKSNGKRVDPNERNK